MIERTTVRLPHDLLARARKKAATEGSTLTALIEEGLRMVIARPRTRDEGPKRPLPPVSSATGGLMPGIDLTDLAALQEMDDLDVVRRMGKFK